jgi:hypothetical protein
MEGTPNQEATKMFKLNQSTVDHINGGGGLCGTCCNPAAATFENEGYSSCCNDRIEYGGEALDSLRTRLVEEVASADLPKIEVLGSWGNVEKTGWITREGVAQYPGGNKVPAIWMIDENGYAGVIHLSQENKNYGFRRVQA